MLRWASRPWRRISPCRKGWRGPARCWGWTRSTWPARGAWWPSCLGPRRSGRWNACARRRAGKARPASAPSPGRTGARCCSARPWAPGGSWTSSPASSCRGSAEGGSHPAGKNSTPSSPRKEHQGAPRKAVLLCFSWWPWCLPGALGGRASIF